ncbi:hypothetical protein OSTOST_15743 [Ostertagia ostertagi]
MGASTTLLAPFDGYACDVLHRFPTALRFSHRFVVTFSHNSVDKYPANSRLLNNFPCLQLFTTRNMTPGPITDWIWGGLNYQASVFGVARHRAQFAWCLFICLLNRAPSLPNNAPMQSEHMYETGSRNSAAKTTCRI